MNLNSYLIWYESKSDIDMEYDKTGIRNIKIIKSIAREVC